jgi:tRNA uridine 5-carboxymethylaminomethyl modification enzyme
VLADDLVTKGVTEPYRMFTSRAEFRLQLREDNADLRLTEIGRALGLVDDGRWAAFNRKRDAVSRETQRLRSTWIPAGALPDTDARRLIGAPLEREYRLDELLRRPEVDFDVLTQLADLALPELGLSREALRGELGTPLADAVIEQAQIGIKYAGYIDKQIRDVERTAGHEELPLPDDFDYSKVSALSFEARHLLSRHRPRTLGQASRLSGITPAAISLLLVHLKKGRLRATTAAAESLEAH